MSNRNFRDRLPMAYFVERIRYGDNYPVRQALWRQLGEAIRQRYQPDVLQFVSDAITSPRIGLLDSYICRVHVQCVFVGPVNSPSRPSNSKRRTDIDRMYIASTHQRQQSSLWALHICVLHDGRQSTTDGVSGVSNYGVGHRQAALNGTSRLAIRRKSASLLRRKQFDDDGVRNTMHFHPRSASQVDAVDFLPLVGR